MRCSFYGSICYFNAGNWDKIGSLNIADFQNILLQILEEIT